MSLFFFKSFFECLNFRWRISIFNPKVSLDIPLPQPTLFQLVIFINAFSFGGGGQLLAAQLSMTAGTVESEGVDLERACALLIP